MTGFECARILPPADVQDSAATFIATVKGLGGIATGTLTFADAQSHLHSAPSGFLL
jgi:hypothetical protein